MAAATKSICKTQINEGNYESLSQYCPAEAKVFREAQRQKNCEGRVYTGIPKAEGIKMCLNGDEDGINAAVNKAKPAPDSTPSIRDGATKLLKGYLGF